MPLDLNWEAVRTLATEIGIVATAERLGITQHLAALYQRSKREGWLRDIPRSQPLPPTMLKPVSCVSTPAQALAASMRDDSVQGRAEALKLARRKIQALSRKDDDELLLPELISAAHTTTKDLAISGAWNAETALTRVDLRIISERGSPVTLEAEWSDLSQSQVFDE